ncbi:hypothetical protein BD769DRAFT_766313 [Suillus cothurnatus]|nr:hypothetical protein BD769DRAFT_766313 [Suillus cothurnatus]
MLVQEHQWTATKQGYTVAQTKRSGSLGSRLSYPLSRALHPSSILQVRKKLQNLRSRCYCSADGLWSRLLRLRSDVARALSLINRATNLEDPRFFTYMVLAAQTILACELDQRPDLYDVYVVEPLTLFGDRPRYSECDHV